MNNLISILEYINRLSSCTGRFKGIDRFMHESMEILLRLRVKREDLESHLLQCDATSRDPRGIAEIKRAISDVKKDMDCIRNQIQLMLSDAKNELSCLAEQLSDTLTSARQLQNTSTSNSTTDNIPVLSNFDVKLPDVSKSPQMVSDIIHSALPLAEAAMMALDTFGKIAQMLLRPDDKEKKDELERQIDRLANIIIDQVSQNLTEKPESCKKEKSSHQNVEGCKVVECEYTVEDILCRHEVVITEDKQDYWRNAVEKYIEPSGRGLKWKGENVTQLAVFLYFMFGSEVDWAKFQRLFNQGKLNDKFNSARYTKNPKKSYGYMLSMIFGEKADEIIDGFWRTGNTFPDFR